jgi:hypothetical protein
VAAHESAANALLNTLCQSSETTDMVTWQKFDNALTRTAASYRILVVADIY